MWHNPAYYLLIFIGVLIYAIVAMVVRKTATIHIGVCSTHYEKRRTAIIASWVLMALGLGGIIFAISYNTGALALIGGLLMLCGIIYGVIAARLVTPKKIDDRFVWLNSVDRNYLAQLPQWPGGS